MPMPTAVGSCPRLTPPPADLPLALPAHGLWSRHILQQTLMDEGLRLARLVSHDRMGRLSPCVPAKPPLAGEAASSAVPKHPHHPGPHSNPGVPGARWKKEGHSPQSCRRVVLQPARPWAEERRTVQGCSLWGESDPIGAL